MWFILEAIRSKRTVLTESVKVKRFYHMVKSFDKSRL